MFQPLFLQVSILPKAISSNSDYSSLLCSGEKNKHYWTQQTNCCYLNSFHPSSCSLPSSSFQVFSLFSSSLLCFSVSTATRSAQYSTVPLETPFQWQLEMHRQVFMAVRLCTHYLLKIFSLQSIFICTHQQINANKTALVHKAKVLKVTVTISEVYNNMSLSSAVSCGNNQYNMNSPSTSMVTINIRNYSPMCARAACTSHGYYSRAAFILFRGSADVATIRERHLFKEIQYVHVTPVQPMKHGIG